MYQAHARTAMLWATRRLGVEVRRKPDALIRSAHELRLTPQLLAASLEALAPPAKRTVVQVGAFDALANDPVREIIDSLGWQGILVEPQPEPFARASAAYDSSPSVQAFNVAIADTVGVRPLFTVPPHPDLPEWTQQVASFEVKHLRKQQASLPARIDLEHHIRRIDVQAWTFERLLTEASASRVDMLQIDTEGYDYEVLRMFDLKRWKPTIVNYEHAHLSRRDQDAAARFLIAHGYKLSMSFDVGSADTLAFRPPTTGRGDG